MTTPVGRDLELDADVADALNADWITREDAALKKRLSGIRVPVANEQEIDDNDHDGPRTKVVIDSKTRVVPVYFRLSEDEVRAQTFPYITIDFLQPIRDVEREHRGVFDYGLANDDYAPPGMPAGGGRAEMPVPFILQYQITTWARWNRHDRIINTTLMTSRLEPRFGYLEMDGGMGTVDDGSVRRMDLLGGPTNNDGRDQHGKRVFRKVYTVGVSSELFHADFQQYMAASRLVLDPAQSGYSSV